MSSQEPIRHLRPSKPIPPVILEWLETVAQVQPLDPWQQELLGSMYRPQPLPQPDLKPYLEAINREIYLLSLQGQVPIRFMTGAKIPLRDRIWARFQMFRRFLWRLRNR